MILAIRAIDPKDHSEELLKSLSVMIESETFSEAVKVAAREQIELMENSIDRENKGLELEKGKCPLHFEEEAVDKL